MPRVPAPRPAADELAPPPGQTAGRAPKRRSRAKAAPAAVPLGSLTQRDHRSEAFCRACGSAHVTRLMINLTDGTPVEFTSCHHCEHRTWEHAGGELSVDTVLERSRKS